MSPVIRGIRASKAALTLGLVLTLLLIACVDYLTGHEVSTFVFYFAPIGAAAYWLGPSRMIALALLSTALWALADSASRVDPSAGLTAWNALVRLFSFLSIGAAISRIATLLERERALVTSLQVTLGAVRTLEGLLPLCAQCKKIRDGEGVWRDIDVYLRDHTKSQISHGLCPACAGDFLRAAGLADDLPTTEARQPAAPPP